MTITLTKDEISQFVTEMQYWYQNKVQFVFENTLASARAYDCLGGNARDMAERVTKLSHQYDEEHPQPDWFTLVK